VEVEGRGPDVVLLHGWGFHSGAWHDVVRALAPRHRVHRIDLPGHGLSADGPADFDGAAQALAEAIPEDSIVVGWSLGGLFAQRLAARRARRLRGVMLVSSTPCFVQRDGWTCAMRPGTVDAFAADLAHDPARTLGQFVRLNALNGPRSRETARALTARLAERPAPSERALRHGLAWLREVDVRAEVPALETPCVVVHGTRDAIAPFGAGEWLAATWPGARLVRIEDAAHLPFASHAESFHEALEMLLG
jgi:pimeloyl-[acyl-carrier protein] methyl ester esterase